ncbi:MAG: hypothetical protein R2747_20035 [Pyrinomonadaceae bacterium]
MSPVNCCEKNRPGADKEFGNCLFDRQFFFCLPFTAAIIWAGRGVSRGEIADLSMQEKSGIKSRQENYRPGNQGLNIDVHNG